MALEKTRVYETQLPDQMFRYKPINGDIRLITLERGEGKDEIRWKMFDTEFSTDPLYTALSYEWGRAGEESSIWIDGQYHTFGSSLSMALSYIRRSDKDLVLWVDALCIDQQNIRERNHQVELMGKIYGQAAEVAIWLGPARDDSDQAMAQFREISRDITLGKPIGRPIMHVEAMLLWCRRSYWRRMWVIQEIQLGRELFIHCGRECIKWVEFARTRQWILSWTERFGLEKEIYDAMILSLPARMDEFKVRGNARQTPLIDWLESFERSLCTDPKDKVYALVGLASDCQKGELCVDYSKSLSQIFLDLLRLYMQREVTSPANSTTDTASLLFLSCCLFKWLNLDLRQQIDETMEKIWVRGTYHGSIAILGPEYQVSPTRTSQVRVGRRDKPVIILSKRLSSVSAVSCRTAFATMPTLQGRIYKTIIGRLFSEAESKKTLQEYGMDSEFLLLAIDGDYWSLPGEKMVGLRTAITAEGETIVVPPSTRHDDKICILPGCDIALIFRKFSQWTLEGVGVYSMSRSQPVHGEAVNMCLDIAALEKITAAAQFAPVTEINPPWWHQK